jgi:succinoglycan biosynthesis transport protein ExoP
MNMQTSMTDTMEEPSSLGAILPHLPTIILQRIWLFLIPALVGLIIGVAAAYLLPTTYQSKAVLLVEAPLLPQDVASDVGGIEMIDQRMARIRQEIMSRSQLIEIINRNGLYQSELKIKTFSEVIEQMRSAIKIEPVTANIQANRQRGTIAFSISYDYSDPIKAQAVLQSLTDEIREINSSTQSQQATNTVQFLSDQAAELQTQISELETNILSIKSANGAALSGTSFALGSPDGLQSQINTARRAQRELAQTATQRDPAVQQAESTLAALRATYTESHPDVTLAKQRLEEAKRLADTREQALPVDRTAQIDSQISTNNRQIGILRNAMGNASSGIAAARQAPALMEQLNQLAQKLEGLNTQYRRVQLQLASARAGKRADDEQQGERLRLVESPTIPDTPISPNRPMLIGGGLIMGLGLGLAAILGLELLRRPIRHVSVVTYTMGEPPLVVIPTIYAPGDRKGGFFSRLFSGRGKDDDDDDD